MSDLLLTELERQRKYLDQLPTDYKFPLFNARKALESQRRSGYNGTAAAAREIVDNAIEAGARRVHVVFDTVKRARTNVSAVAFVDDGPGMLPAMARFALSWGGGTHSDEPSFIGKFGFGLPNASINQTRRTAVYTRTEPEGPFRRAVLDLDLYSTDFGIQEVPKETEVATLPPFVQEHLKRAKWSFKTGTIIVWESPDRLSYKSPNHLQRQLINDFGTTYRYLLDRVELVVAGASVEPVDPLFLTPEFRLYKPEADGGAIRTEDTVIPVVIRKDPETGGMEYSRLRDSAGIDNDPAVIGTSAFRIIVARFPYGFVQGGREAARQSEEYARFEVRKTRRGISFVRANREIETVDAFPRGNDRKDDLGDWPLLQGYAYHFGMEIRFDPDLDDLFGITNDKQSVRPEESFWKLMHDEGVDALLREENRWQGKERQGKQQQQQADRALSSDGPAVAVLAAQAAERALGDGASFPPSLLEEARANEDVAVKSLAAEQGIPEDEARKEFGRRAKRARYVIEFYDQADGPAWNPIPRGLQVVLQINKEHPFYPEVYAPLLTTPSVARVKVGLDLLLFTLAKAELEAPDEMRSWYAGQRRGKWSTFLEFGLRSLSDTLDTETDEEEMDDVGAEEDQPADAEPVA